MSLPAPTSPSFDAFYVPSPHGQTPLRRAVTEAWRLPEPEAVQRLLPDATLDASQSAQAQALALRIARTLRASRGQSGRSGIVQSLLQEYALSSQEGVALMCLAEALLRIPDLATRDALIRDKIADGRWNDHLGNSASLFVNAATWGLLITGKLASTHSRTGLSSALGRLVNKGGEPLVRRGVDMAMRMMGEQFVTGESIDEALRNSREKEAEGFRYSYDMLGEAALTAHDARRYLQDYETAIHAIGAASARRGVYAGPGISIKLSALHPRYSRAQQERVFAELYPILVRLCALAKRHDIGLNIDAEEADRLELSLDLLEKLCFEPQLAGWNGLGFVIQAYQKRCPFVVDLIVDMARRSRRRLMIRLVKGAYWDTEIKRAQVEGQSDYPVFTRKPYTDVSYIACARKLLAAPEQVFPQFATHNAHTLSAIHELADPATYTPDQYEFQCLHGMGEPLYAQVVGDAASGRLGRNCRIYAPVGTHETLLAYLVRRLLENGANTSFVNRIADASISLEDLVRDPTEVVREWARDEQVIGRPHPAIPLPSQLYAGHRRNSAGLDLANEIELARLQRALVESTHGRADDGAPSGDAARNPVAIANPANTSDLVGRIDLATPPSATTAVEAAVAAAPAWAATPSAERARLLEAAADGLETAMSPLIGLLIREAGKTAANAVSEVREAVDFLRYYASEVRSRFDNATHRPLGPVVCISPWNFPLAIFIGQVSAALAAGNVVLAKPAEQTPLVAAQAVRLLHEAGVPQHAVQLVPGDGATVGAALVADARVQGVLFTGSTEVARIIQRALVGRVGPSGRPVPLVAETGGQNAMIVDSSALTEQVVQDVIGSAFDSAGQRCSALRVLCVQEDVADAVMHMLLGAMAELRIGDPARLATDVGPVIDEEARSNIVRHLEQMRAQGFRVHQVSGLSGPDLAHGHFVLPTVIEIDRIGRLEREVFGPVLHVVRYDRERFDQLLDDINATGYGLTLGVHTRINETIDRVVERGAAGNKYVNRNMVGAVVGVQPFGGDGLSGTGPKAGGPLYLYRLLSERPDDAFAPWLPLQATGEDAHADEHRAQALAALSKFAEGRFDLAAVQRRLPRPVALGRGFTLAGPTGESNEYSLAPRRRVLSLANDDRDLLAQLHTVIALGSRAVWSAQRQALWSGLPASVRSFVELRTDAELPAAGIDLALIHGDAQQLRELQGRLAAMDGPVVGVERIAPGSPDIPLERLVVEHAVSINTAAAGGNASLMTVG